MKIDLMITPGVGFVEAEMAEGATLYDLAQKFDLYERKMIVEGSNVNPREWKNTPLTDNIEVVATEDTKGA